MNWVRHVILLLLPVALVQPEPLRAENVECGLLLFEREGAARVNDDPLTEGRVCARISQKSAHGELHWVHPINNQVMLGIVPFSLKPEQVPDLSALKLEIRYHYSGETPSQRGDDEPDQTYTFPRPTLPDTGPPDDDDNGPQPGTPSINGVGTSPHTFIGSRLSIPAPRYRDEGELLGVSVRCLPSGDADPLDGEAVHNILDLGTLSVEDICQ